MRLKASKRGVRSRNNWNESGSGSRRSIVTFRIKCFWGGGGGAEQALVPAMCKLFTTPAQFTHFTYLSHSLHKNRIRRLPAPAPPRLHNAAQHARKLLFVRTTNYTDQDVYGFHRAKSILLIRYDDIMLFENNHCRYNRLLERSVISLILVSSVETTTQLLRCHHNHIHLLATYRSNNWCC